MLSVADLSDIERHSSYLLAHGRIIRTGFMAVQLLSRHRVIRVTDSLGIEASLGIYFILHPGGRHWRWTFDAQYMIRLDYRRKDHFRD